MPVEIRSLTGADAREFQALRLRSLRESPDAFGSSYDEELNVSLDSVAQRLEATHSPTARIVLGAFADGVLVGVAGCAQDAKVKSRHKAVIWGLYVAPEARGAGVGRALLDRAVVEAKT